MYAFIASYAHMLNRLLVKRYWASKLLTVADVKKGTDYSVVSPSFAVYFKLARVECCVHFGVSSPL